MKKLALATLIASTFTTTAFAAQEAESRLTASGVLSAGGYTTTDGKFINGGATGADLTVEWNKGNWAVQYGMEADLQDEHAKHSLDSANFETIDAWVGYKFGDAGTLKAGFRGDSALDNVDSYYDHTIEFGYGLNSASDVGSFISFEKNEGTAVYGVTMYADRNTNKSDVVGFNGYVGLRGEKGGMNVGFEVNDKTNPEGVKEIVMVNGSYSLGKVNLGATASLETRTDGSNRAQYGITSGMDLNDKFYIAAGYHIADEARDTVNAGGKYQITPHLTGLFDVAYHVCDEAGAGMKGETEVFFRLDYAL